MNQELPSVYTVVRKARGTGDQIANIHWIIKKSIEKAKEFEKSTLKPLTVWITINCGKFLNRCETRPPDLPLEKPVCRSGSNS